MTLVNPVDSTVDGRYCDTVVVLGGTSMTTIDRNSDDSGPVHDYAWHRKHRTRRGGQWIDLVMVAGWTALVGWGLLRQ
jgi:hypothetical protein